MANATGVAKQLRYKAESTWGTAAGTATGSMLRRVTSTLDLRKQTYQSNEIRSDYQVADFRHGVRSVEGSISGELSPGTYEDFFAAALRKDFVAVSAISSLSLTIATSGSQYTVTRGSGSYLTDAIKVGDVVRLTGGSLNAANASKNLLITALTATIATVTVLNGVAMVAEGPIASCTMTVTGKKSYVPTTSHTDKSFSIEHWFADIAQSELFTGCKVNSVGINLPASGIATVEFGFMGKDVTTASAEYFATGTLVAATSSGVLAAVNGVVAVGATPIALLTGLQINIAGGMTAEPVVGANTYPDIFEGRVQVSGQFSAFFVDATLRDYFLNETEVAIYGAFTTGSSATADFLSFVLPRIKVGGATKDDGEKGIIATFPFTALYNSSGGTGTASEASTIVIQDSLA